MTNLSRLLFLLIISFSFTYCSSSGDKKENKEPEKKDSEIKDQEAKIFVRTFGDKEKPAMIFLHGGPGYNCANFEASTAQKLADKGYFVIVYDRRGEGRSPDPKAAFTFAQTFDDLNKIYADYGLDSANLIGHSYGGVVATLFAEKNPDKVSSILLVGAPVSLQETFRNIISKCRKIYTGKKDSDNLKYIEMLEKMDTTTIEYSSYCFGHAMQNGFYFPAEPTEEAKKLYESLKTDTLILKYGRNMTPEAPQGFMDNEKYTSINLTGNIKNLVSMNIPVYGLYGKDDGLYSPEQIKKLESLIGKDRLKYFDNCSHNVFVDQQTEFLNTLVEWCK